jgi:S1-C subfamily serine protease
MRTKDRFNLCDWVLPLIVLVLGAGCGVAKLWEPPREKVLADVLASAVQVVLEQQEGRRFRTASGVAIGAHRTPEGPQCFILTSGHTFTDNARGQDIFVIVGSHQAVGTKVPATLLAARDAGRQDLALLKANTDQCVPARIRRPPNLGDFVWVVAFPWGRRLTLARGIISQVDLDRPADPTQETRLMVDASVSYGSSGAGVFEERTGALIGIVEGYSTARVSFPGASASSYIDVPVPGQTFVSPLAQVRRFLNEIGHDEFLPRPEP